MTAFTTRTTLLLCALALPFGAVADDVTSQPVLSERYEVADAMAAMQTVMDRWDAAQAEQQARFGAFDGDFADFVRTDPILQDVTWPYGSCTDLVSLIPPPAENWAIRSEFALRDNPVTPDRAEIFFVSYDPTRASDDPNFWTDSKTVTIRITSSPDQTQSLQMMLSEPMMRDAMFEPGPFGYPKQRFANATLLGPYLVDVTGTGEEAPAQYFEQIVGCAIDSGLIAEGVDRATLTR